MLTILSVGLLKPPYDKIAFVNQIMTNRDKRWTIHSGTIQIKIDCVSMIGANNKKSVSQDDDDICCTRQTHWTGISL